MSKAITLGRLITELKLCEPDSSVRFDFGYMSPTTLDSYRGDYAQLALGYQEATRPTVADLVKHLESAIGKSFEGYKGGTYYMSKDTPVWAANYGEYTSTAILRANDYGYQVVLETAYED